jgi:eukaryotic-like serine/threonine-protein kinase
VPPATARITLPRRYRVVRHLANGGMASVWEAHDELLDRPVAVKVLASHLDEDDQARRRFAREARTAAGLSSHPHVVTIYDVVEAEGKSCIVMELLRGGTVADRLRAGDAIPHRVALRWLAEAGSALDAAHEAGIVHRDVKPANMLLDTQRTSSAGTAVKDRLAIGDFGIARLGLEDQITQTGQVLGTAAYISPEQALGEPATAASDRYALAAVAFELLTGSKPFTADNFAAQARAHVEEPPPRASERDIDVPAAADAVLRRGMAKEAADRWESAGAMVRALDDALTAPPPRRRAAGAGATRVMAPTPPRGGGPPPRGGTSTGSHGPRRRLGAGALIALAALLLVVAGAIALATQDGGDGDDPGRTAQREPTATATADATRTVESTATPDATATPAQTTEPEQSAPPEQKPKKPKKAKNGVPGEDAAALQLQAFELNNAGDHEQALAYAGKAVDLCEGSTAVDPCAYALFEYARALRLTGDPEGAIAALEERKQRFPDNQAGTVEEELARARADAGEGEGD